ncbi:Glycosylphosphatidylinositol anchor biosynthesis protein 11, partial [Trichinella britovi]
LLLYRFCYLSLIVNNFKAKRCILKFSIKMVVQFFSELLVVSMVNYVLVVLCGASTSTIKENYLLAAIITVCTAVPALLFIQNWDQLLGVVFERKLIRKTDFFVHYITHGTYLGAYLGAIPVPLDWDRPWQYSVLSVFDFQDK